MYVDQLIFAAEELSLKHTLFFAENEMLERLKNSWTDKVGESFYCNGECTIKEVRTEVNEDYYHAAGLSLIDSLTNWHLEKFFPEFFEK